MKLKFFISIVMLGFSFSATSQIASNDILFKVDGEPILAEEFIRVYNKNLDLVKDEKQKDVDEYLKLFVNYQLKLKEAKRLELDKNPKYLREFKNYKNQLTKNYMSESNVTEKLVEEAYNRISYDVNVSHILIRLDEMETDTLDTYNRISELRQRAIAEGFDKVKDEVHNGKTVFGESLGYFSAFKMVYDFETVAYNTEVGDVSEPFRTQFGYHVLKVNDKRPSRGEVTVAHIMVSLKQKDSTLNPEARILEINKKLKQGENFENLAKQFSDDKSSANKGGKLQAFKSGQLSSTKFEDMAFSLQEEGALTEPFKSEYGWHIVKLINKKPIAAYDDMKSNLQNRVKRDSRSKLINSALAKKLSKTFEVEVINDGAKHMATALSEDFTKKVWQMPEDFDYNQPILKINDQTISCKQFAKHLRANQRQYFGKTYKNKAIVKRELEKFKEISILNYHKENLEQTNPEFANVLKEYRDGLLLFDLMEKQIWNKAYKDSVGLQNYYNNHKEDYKWNERIDIIMASAAKKKTIKTVKELLKSEMTLEAISAKLNSEKEQNVIFTKGIKDVGDATLPKDLEVVLGDSKIYDHNDSYHLIRIKKILPASNKTFEEARGLVVNNYQNQIENDWINELKSRFPVDIDAAILQKVKQQIYNQ